MRRANTIGIQRDDLAFTAFTVFNPMVNVKIMNIEYSQVARSLMIFFKSYNYIKIVLGSSLFNLELIENHFRIKP